jgi:TonB family protein
MSKYEKLGGFLLFEKLEEDKLSKSFLAGQIVNNEIKNINIVKKFDHSLSTLPDFILDLNQQFEILKGLSNPNIVRPSAVVQEKSEYAAIFEYLEGKTLRALLTKCAQDGYPFTADHALLIGSRLCTAIEYIHSKKTNEERLVHGLVCPETVLVTYDGEIKLQYMALAHALLKFPAGKDKFLHDYKNYMSPEMLNQGKLDRSVDIFASGLVLYEMLTGEAFFAKGRNVSVNDVISQAQMHTNSGERSDLPEDIKKILYQALAMDPAQRYASIGDMRKALDMLLFSSEFSPTTFNLAFFMHSVFREKIDEESKNLAAFKKMDVAAYLKEEPPPPPPKPEHPVGATAAKDMPVSPIPMEKPAQPAYAGPELFGGEQEPKEKSKMPLIIGGVLVLAVVGVLAVFMMGKKAPQPAQTASVRAMTPEQEKQAAEERAQLEAQAKQAQEEAKKKDEELKVLQAKLDEILKQQQKSAANPSSPAPAVDTAAIQKLQEQAKKLEEEKKAKEAEAAKLKEAAAAPAVPPPAATETPSTTTPAGGDATKIAANTATTTPPPAGNMDQQQPAGGGNQQPQVEPAAAQPAGTKEGDLVELSSDVVKPEVLSKTNPAYPAVASAKKIEGTVILSLLISEKGDVSDAKLLRGAGGASGLNEAAMAAVRKWKFRPAVKDGKRVKVWMTYPIVFKLQ